MKNLLFTRKILIIGLVLFSLSGCQEEFESSQPITVSGNERPIVSNEQTIIPYYFDWETVYYMPYPSAINIPWTGSGSLYGTVENDILADRKKSDGWELLYSSFSPSVAEVNPYFILYNKYRGLMRIFLYVNSLGSFANPNSDYLQEGIYTNSGLEILNFDKKEVIDLFNISTRVDNVQEKPFYGTSLNRGHKWYFHQYEMAYDPAIVPTTSADPPRLAFYMSSIDITKVSLGEDIKGELNGTIGRGSSEGDNFFSKTKPTLTELGKVGISALGAEYIEKRTINESTGENKIGLSKKIFKGISKGVDAALSGGTTGVIKNVLSLILGGSSESNTMSLNVDAELSLSGTFESNGSLPTSPIFFYVPGSLATKSDGTYYVSGYVPHFYNKPLGVFNLSSAPTVNVENDLYYCEGAYNSYAEARYTLDVNSFNIQWNPAVTEIATIKNITMELVVRDRESIGDEYVGTVEEIQGFPALTRPASSSYFYIYRRKNGFPFPVGGTVYVRISFVVDPNGSAPESKIVKTFKANINESYEYHSGC